MLTRRKAVRTRGEPRHGSTFPGRIGRAASAGLMTAVLGGCTLSDSLIPPNPIPETRPADLSVYSRNGTPIDPSAGEDRMAAAAPASGPVQAAPLPPAVNRTEPRREPSYRTAGAEGRAVAFPASAPTQPRRPAAAAPPPVGQRQREATGSPVLARREPERHAAAAIRFTPVIGAPVSAIRPLSEELEKSALRHGVVIRNTADKPVDNILRGYFSASGRGSHTELVYMWDILDSSGTLLHRLQGTLELPGGSGKPWDSVPEATMRDVARKTISAYLAWRNEHAG